MGKVKDTTYQPTSYNEISDTPKNFKADNYFLHTLQDKVNADWKYRPNRVDVEQEKNFGQEDFFPLEVVVQPVRNDSGVKISDDWCRLVFKDIRYVAPMGTKFRFSYRFDLDEPVNEKSVWLTVNKDSTSPTTQVVVNRCNGTLGSIYTDDKGKQQYHYEPAIAARELKTVGIYYTNVINTAQSDLVLVVQANKYTNNYYINQRFVVGKKEIYKVSAINSFDSLSTYNPDDVRLLILYVKYDELGPEDNLTTRIAYNKPISLPEPPPIIIDNYNFKILAPSPIPLELFSESIIFTCGLFNGEIETVIEELNIDTNLLGTEKPENYFRLEKINNNSFSLQRLKVFSKSLLSIRCFIPADKSPVGEELSQSFEMSLRGLE